MSRRMIWAEFVAGNDERRNGYMLLVEKSEGKRQLARRRHRRNEIKMDLKERGRVGVDWVYDLSGSGEKGDVAGFCEHGNEFSDVLSLGEFLE
jgi:hypothetical protein